MFMRDRVRVSKGAKIRNRYNQVPHLTQETNGIPKRILVHQNSDEILDKLKARDATSLSTYDFSTLYTTLPHNLIKDKLIDLIEENKKNFQREGSPYLACNDRNAFLPWKN